jgi:hypothetical protein
MFQQFPIYYFLIFKVIYKKWFLFLIELALKISIKNLFRCLGRLKLSMEDQTVAMITC